MNTLYLACKPFLMSYEQYIQRLDSVITSSADIQTIQEAKDYWIKHFGNRQFNLTVHTKSKNIAIKAYFDADNDHGYTESERGKDEIKTGKRIFSKERANLLDRIKIAIEHPQSILEHYGRELYLERIEGGKHYCVVLGWKDGKQRYEFSSAYPMSASDLLELKRHTRPIRPQGKALPPKK